MSLVRTAPVQLVGGWLLCQRALGLKTWRDAPDQPMPLGVCSQKGEVNYNATTESLMAHPPMPKWLSDARLGVSLNWGAFSVLNLPDERGDDGFQRWAEEDKAGMGDDGFQRWTSEDKTGIQGRWWKHRFGENYSDDAYYRFVESTFNEATRDWDPADVVKLAQEAGAKFVMLHAKNWDGFGLWRTDLHGEAHRAHKSERDIMGDLTKAARTAGMEVGLVYNHRGSDLASVHLAELEEIIKKYRPSILTGTTFPWSAAGEKTTTATTGFMQLWAEYLNSYCPQGALMSEPLWASPGYGDHDNIHNDDIRGSQSDESKNLWEVQRDPINVVHFLGSGTSLAKDFVVTLAEVTAINAVTTIIVSPRPDGSLREEHTLFFRELGEWMKVNGEAIHGTRPYWEPGTRFTGEFRFTKTADYVYAIMLEPGDEAYFNLGVRELGRPDRVLTVELLTPSGPKAVERLPDGRVALPQAAKRLAAIKGAPVVLRMKLE